MSELVVPLKRSCDRCSRTRAKCTYSTDRTKCDLCERLRHVCTTSRAFVQRGRKRKDEALYLKKKSEKELVWIVNGGTRTASAHPDNLPHSDQLWVHNEVTKNQHATGHQINFYQLPPPEEQVLEILWAKNQFVSNVIIGPSFEKLLQTSLEKCYTSAPAFLKEGYLAVSAAFVQVQRGTLGYDEVNLRRSAVALRKLRCCKVDTSSQVLILCVLGMCLITFEMLTASKSVRSVVKYSLSVLDRVGFTFDNDPLMDCHAYSLLFIDNVQCLVHGDIPSMKYRPGGVPTTDRAIGFCSSLLPLLYESCEVSCIARRNMSKDDVNHDLGAFTNIERKLECWQPTWTPRIQSQYSNNEIDLMSTHASVYPQAILLLLHRLKYPYGMEDDAASLKANKILQELETCFSITGELPFQISLPLLLAALESVKMNKRANLLFKIYRTARPAFKSYFANFERFIEQAWRIKDQKITTSWFELIDSMPGLLLLP